MIKSHRNIIDGLLKCFSETAVICRRRLTNPNCKYKTFILSMWLHSNCYSVHCMVRLLSVKTLFFFIQLTHSWRRSLSYKTQFLIYSANQQTGFYMIETSVMKELIIFHNLFWVSAIFLKVPVSYKLLIQYLSVIKI